jgi:hypothetical protein
VSNSAARCLVVGTSNNINNNFAIGRDVVIGSSTTAVYNSGGLGRLIDIFKSESVGIGRNLKVNQNSTQGASDTTTTSSDIVLVGSYNDRDNINYTSNYMPATFMLGAGYGNFDNARRNAIIVTKRGTIGGIPNVGAVSNVESCVILPEVGEHHNYANDCAAAQAGIPLYGLYHDNGDMKIRITECPDPTTTTTSTTVLNPSPGTRFTFSSNGNLDGDGQRIYFADSLTNLDGANNYGIPTAYIYGSSLVASDNGFRSDYKCTTNNPPTEYQQFTFTRELLQDGGVGRLTQGSFYVTFSLEKSQTGGSQQYIDQNCAVMYRANNTQNWNRAVDIFGDICKPGATWNAVYGGMVSENTSGNGLLRVFNAAGSPTGTGQLASQYFIFDTPGEYRVTMGALYGPILAYSSCTTPQTVNDSFSLDTDDAAPTAAFYEYKISSVGGNCSNQMLTTVYAKEWMPKYVTQFYSNTALTTPASLSTGTYRYRRSSVNLEYTKDGSYTATFTNDVKSSRAIPCFYS